MSSLTSEIPVVDLDDLASPKASRQRVACDALMKGFGTYGLVYVRNHGLGAQELDAFYDEFLEFTNRPESAKREVSMDEIWFQRGWTPPNTEKAVVAGGQPDFKECYFMAPEPLREEDRLQYPPIYAPNVWPSDAQAFEDIYTDIGRQIHQIGMTLLRGAARALDLEPYRFEQGVHHGPHVTRALRYLPVTPEQVEAGILWGEEHTDFNLLTLLPGGRFLDESLQRCPKPDPDSGLYLRTRPSAEHPRGQMVPGRPPKGCMVAQVGQQLEILTGGAFLATPHVIKAPNTTGYSRVSMAHFIHLRSHQMLFPFEKFRTPETVRAYSPPVLAGTYGLKTLVDIGLAPAEAMDQLGYRHYGRLGQMRAEEDA